MAQRIRERPLEALWIAVAVMLLGRLLDLRWHLTHDEFEGTSQQFEAHWLVWLGVLAVLAVSAVGVRAGIGGLGFRLALASSVGYVPVSVWHFIEHANGADPELAHVLLAITNLGMVIGAAIVTLAARRTGQPASLTTWPSCRYEFSIRHAAQPTQW